MAKAKTCPLQTGQTMFVSSTVKDGGSDSVGRLDVISHIVPSQRGGFGGYRGFKASMKSLFP